MRTYVDITFAADGPSVVEVARRLKEIAGLEVIPGEHDLKFDWSSRDEFDAIVDRMQRALRNTGATFRLNSVMVDGEYMPPIVWAVPPSLNDTIPQNHARPAPSNHGTNGNGH